MNTRGVVLVNTRIRLLLLLLERTQDPDLIRLREASLLGLQGCLANSPRTKPHNTEHNTTPLRVAFRVCSSTSRLL